MPWSRSLVWICLFCAASPCWAQNGPPQLRDTYSIVAWDPEAGHMGVAVQSHWFDVGAMVPWARAGVGVVATQALTNASFGPRGLDLLAAGKSPREALQILLAEDPQRENRQVAILDVAGRVAVHTGKNCLPAAGHEQGEGFSAQANLMKNQRVWPAMARAYTRAKGPLAQRLWAALAAAQQQGGDLRGAQSAALLVVRLKATGKAWEDRVVHLRLADHPRPIQELKRLLRLHRAYAAWSAADQALAEGKKQQAAQKYAQARRLAPNQPELRFWQGISLFKNGQVDRAADVLGPLVVPKSPWAILLPRLVAGGVLSSRQLEVLQAKLGQKDVPQGGR